MNQKLLAWLLGQKVQSRRKLEQVEGAEEEEEKNSQSFD